MGSPFLLLRKHMGGTWDSWAGLPGTTPRVWGTVGAGRSHTRGWRVPELEPRWKRQPWTDPPWQAEVLWPCELSRSSSEGKEKPILFSASVVAFPDTVD